MEKATYNITINTNVSAKDVVREIQKYHLRQMQKPTRPDDDGAAGVAAMVPAIPPRDSGGMYVDAS